jgi:hypothetical protein
MNNQQQKNRTTIIMLFGMTVIPFCIAWYLSNHTELVATGKTSNGELVIPVITTEKTDFIGFDKFSVDNMGELSRHWVIANLIPTEECKQACQEAIYKSKQLHLMLSKDLTRVRRVALLLTEVSPEKTTQWWAGDSRLLKAKASAALMAKIKHIRKGSVPEGMLFLIDPLGNIMMQYEPGFDPYKVEKDLKKLLNVSQIG